MKFLMCLFLTLLAHGIDHSQSYKEGESLGRNSSPDLSDHNLGEVKNTAGFVTDNPKETKYWDAPETMANVAQRELRKKPKKKDKQKDGEEEEVLPGHTLIITEKLRTKEVIDPQTDPLILNANEAINNPEKVLKATSEEDRSYTSEGSKHTCYEAGEPEEYSCTIRRYVTLKTIPTQSMQINVQRYRDCFSGPLSMNILTGERLDAQAHYHGPEHAAGLGYNGAGFPAELVSRVRSSRVVSGPYSITHDHIVHCAAPGQCHRSTTHGTIEITYAPLPTEADLIEKIDDKCISYEGACDDGNCHYGEEFVLEGQETRTISNGKDGLKVTRPWWHKKRTYYCGAKSKNDCAELRKKGCVGIHAKCHRKMGSRCVEWKRTLQCPVEKGSIRKVKTTGHDLPFGLDGSQADQTWEPNRDMTEVLAKMSLLKEIHKEAALVKEGKIFQGQGMSCSKHCVNFSDCCSLSSGWGESMKLTKCSRSEQLLREKRKEGKCHLIGTYCAERLKPSNVCVKKKTVFCCFDSKLSRLIHEQGRAQLKIGWGCAESPNCRALTITELTAINFERVDFNEIFKDVLDKVSLKKFDAQGLQKTVDQFQKNWVARLPTKSEISEENKMKNLTDKRRLEVSQVQPATYSMNEIFKHGPLEERDSRLVF